MQCPYCRDVDTKVVDSRDADGGGAVRRRRQCVACDQRFTTYERVEEVPLLVRKRDDTREPFDRAKVISGIAKACKNRPVDDDAMLRLCDDVEERLRGMGAEVTSTDVGREVLGLLRGIDDVAYVRFASVYREFDDVDDFAKVLREFEKRSPPKRRRGRVTAGK